MLGKPIEDVFGGTRFTPNFTRNGICHACFMENFHGVFQNFCFPNGSSCAYTFYKQLGSDPQKSKLFVLFKILGRVAWWLATCAWKPRVPGSSPAASYAQR